MATGGIEPPAQLAQAAVQAVREGVQEQEGGRVLRDWAVHGGGDAVGGEARDVEGDRIGKGDGR